MSVDLGELYRSARLRIGDLVAVDLVAGDLADAVAGDVGAVRVPATPLWDVHDVLAHLSGIVDDVRDGNMEGATTDPWTAAQVDRGRLRSVAELVERWADGAPMLEGFLSSPDGINAYRAVLDVHTHEADLLNALGKPVRLPEEFLEWMNPMMMMRFAERVAEAGLPPVTVDASAMERFRSQLGRRTIDEVVAYDWSSDPTPYLDSWFVFGRAEHSLNEV